MAEHGQGPDDAGSERLSGQAGDEQDDAVGGTLALGDAASATTSGELVPSPWVFSDDTEASAAILAGLSTRLPDGVVKFVPAHSGPLRGPERR